MTGTATMRFEIALAEDRALAALTAQKQKAVDGTDEGEAGPEGGIAVTGERPFGGIGQRCQDRCSERPHDIPHRASACGPGRNRRVATGRAGSGTWGRSRR